MQITLRREAAVWRRLAAHFAVAAVDRQRAREEDLFLDMSSLVINHTINFASLAARSFSRRCVAGEAGQSMVTTIDGNREKMERMGEEGESPRRVG